MYVNNVTIAGRGLKDIQWFKDAFGKAFKIKDLGEAQKILEVRVTSNRSKGTLKLDQTHYVRETLADLYMAKDKAYPIATPMDSDVDLRPSGPDDKRASKVDYQHRIRKWMYLGILTRLDLAFTLRRLS